MGPSPPRWPCALLLAAAATAQADPIGRVLAQNAYAITCADGRFGGPGLDFLVDASAAAQFVLVAEEHNLAELPRFVAALFERLQAAHGFQYLAIESDPVSAAVASTDLRGDLPAIADYARRFPYAFTFATDQELAMIAAVGRRSSARARPVWGFDQVYGAMHVIDFAARRGAPGAALAAVAAAARPHESSRDGELHYLSQVVKDDGFRALARLQPSDADAAHAVAQLLLSDRIYRPYYDEATPERERALRQSASLREQNMKRLFLREYRRAAAADDAPPRVVVKAGHWHLAYGRYRRSQLLTLGNFLAEFATAHEMSTLSLAVHVWDGEEPWRAVKDRDAFAAYRDLVGDDWALVDLRPLRHRWRSEAVEAAGLRTAMFENDLVLLLRGATPGTYDRVHGR